MPVSLILFTRGGDYIEPFERTAAFNMELTLDQCDGIVTFRASLEVQETELGVADAVQLDEPDAVPPHLPEGLRILCTGQCCCRGRKKKNAKDADFTEYISRFT